MMKRVLSIILLMAMLLSLCACDEDGSNSTTNGTSNDNGTQQHGVLANYTLTVKNKAGYALDGVKFTIHSTDGQPVYEGATDTEGNSNIQLDKNGEYVIQLTDVPTGYLAEGEYYFVNQSSEIVLSSQVITDNIPDSPYYELGDVVYDFTVITTDGERFTLSEVLKEKKAVMLTFFYGYVITGTQQFAGEAGNLKQINTVYSSYENDIAVLAVECSLGENEAIAAKNEYSLAFDVTHDKSMGQRFGVMSTFPVDVVIDRNGVFCAQSVGKRAVETFENTFKYFTADDYTLRLFDDLDEIPQGIAPEECPGHSIVSCKITTEATCTTAGTHKGYCKYCATELEEEYFAEHNYSFGVCVDCGKKESEE